MRKPKYRAWHKSEKKMCDVKVLTDEGAFLVGVLKERDQYTSDGKYVIKCNEDGRFCYNDEFELMEFIGIKEYCEGDVFLGTDLEGSQWYVKVIWNDYAWSIWTKEWGYELLCELLPEFDCTYKKVGNIYENPELKQLC